MASTRIAVIDRDKCAKEKCGYQCIKACPGVRMGEETIKAENNDFPIISEPLCTGCGICVKKCPYGAIKIVNLPFETGKPIYQYGVNQFRLYGLPLPKEKNIVGLVGPNGVGKSTALKLLSGKLRPNLGKENASIEEILSMFRGNEIQAYLEKLYSVGVNVAYKPQNLDALASDILLETFLKQFGDDKKIEKVIEEFELKNCRKRRMKELSGGELQRVAMAAVLLKDADVYYIDEPSSYLDIKQRIRMTGKMLKEKLQDKSVLVVEHDLAVLDYLSDYVHVFFGESGAYGMVSGIKGSRVGVNEFLDGYIKEENIRFRDHAISFKVKSETEGGGKGFEYPPLKKTFEGFELRCEGGKIRKGETMGILGANGIGKTTFIKMLAGVEKPDEGEVNFAMKIAYKPQYLTAEDMLVMDYFRNVDSEIMNDLKYRLNLEPLMMKNMTNLSGGELQRVSIAKCLSMDADLLLFDEPSAFLDIEQRIDCAETIKKVIKKYEKTAFIVEHDISFIDSTSNRLIVFEGEPGKSGKASAPLSVRDGMNQFLKEMNITMRREKQSGRPRINKPDSVMDAEQKKVGEYFYYFE